MKKLFSAAAMFIFSLILTGCAASSTSSVGVNCDYSQGKPLWELPLVCQGRQPYIVGSIPPRAIKNLNGAAIAPFAFFQPMVRRKSQNYLIRFEACLVFISLFTLLCDLVQNHSDN